MSATENFHGSQIESSAIECAVADLMGLIRATAEATDNDEYEVRVGMIWTGEEPITILTKDHHGYTYDRGLDSGPSLHTRRDHRERRRIRARLSSPRP